MVQGDDLAKVYAESMAHHPYGYALYKPVSSSILKPGGCGYFDTLGNWQPFVDLTSPESLHKYGLNSPMEELESISPEENITWGPKVSRRVTAVNLGTSGIIRYVFFSPENYILSLYMCLSLAAKYNI
jgi:hypothetical protein